MAGQHLPLAVLPTPLLPFAASSLDERLQGESEAASIGPILPSGLYLSPLGSSFSPSTFSKPGASFPALRSLQRKSSLNPRCCRLPRLPSLIFVCFLFLFL